MIFNLEQAKNLLDFFGGEDSEIVVTEVDESNKDSYHSGYGLYAHFLEYPDEGSLFLGKFGLKEDADIAQEQKTVPEKLAGDPQGDSG